MHTVLPGWEAELMLNSIGVALIVLAICAPGGLIWDIDLTELPAWARVE